MTSLEPEAIATILVEQQHDAPVLSVEPLPGGRNNRTARVIGQTQPWLMKLYFHDQQGGRDRGKTEWDWSNFCWQQGVTHVPKPCGYAATHHASLFEFIAGRRLTADELSEPILDQAVDFLIAVNQHRDHPLASSLGKAAEACFSLEEHLACVDRRIERLFQNPVQDDLDASLRQWLQTSLSPEWVNKKHRIRQQVTSDRMNHVLPHSEWCLSPSDFGFHNALICPTGQIRFFDFEYAGWDDPAKLICDFFWQQQVPVPRTYLTRMLDRLSTSGFGTELPIRVQHLFGVYGFKWCCLVLNEFLANDRRRREFAHTAPLADIRRAEQLERARNLLRTL